MLPHSPLFKKRTSSPTPTLFPWPNSSRLFPQSSSSRPTRRHHALKQPAQSSIRGRCFFCKVRKKPVRPEGSRKVAITLPDQSPPPPTAAMKSSASHSATPLVHRGQNLAERGYCHHSGSLTPRKNVRTRGVASMRDGKAREHEHYPFPLPAADPDGHPQAHIP